MVPFSGTKNGPVFLRAVYKYVGASLFLEPKQVPKTGTQMELLLQKQDLKNPEIINRKKKIEKLKQELRLEQGHPKSENVPKHEVKLNVSTLSARI